MRRSGIQQMPFSGKKQIKSYATVKKLAMIDSSNPEWHDIAEDWFADVCRADPSLRSG
jgi:hypothetical protein